MKRILAGIAALAVVITMVTACGGNNDNSSDNTDASSQNNYAEPAEMRDISSMELIKEMKIGFNLGNTLDSTGGSMNGSPSLYETAWGNPTTTKEMIDMVKDAGFNVLRLPVTWYQHLSGDDYIIDAEWLQRVKEIVDYAIDDGMFVILDTHHEKWVYPDKENLEENKKELELIWKQIGTYFANYDEKLLFEGLNEPRQVGTANEWNGGDEEGWDCVNQLNEVFVKTIRDLGGNNAKRHLVIATYGNNGGENSIKALKIPDDDKVIVDIHAYIPYAYALQVDSDYDTWKVRSDRMDQDEVNQLIDRLKTTFIDNNVAVIVGEMGALSRDNDENRAAWSEHYIAVAKQAGIPCCWWDNGALIGGGELLGLLDRRNMEWQFPLVVEGLMDGLDGSFDNKDFVVEVN